MVAVGMGIGWSINRARYRRAAERVEELNVEVHNLQRLITGLESQVYIDIGQTGGPINRDFQQALKAYKEAMEGQNSINKNE